ncbi:MAG: septal ring lytic transglycosylase RlpA family protein [Mariprofundus sp.]|nr:septal ring lytic transglycosylase RlpA family protein [Mariprofundus sp.]
MQSITSYDQTGIASWYGKDFHGKTTANGERYDMHTLSAAHKTLPLPTLVRVTNLDNGRVITVRVNDRGPFVKERLIDLSYAAAKALDYDRKGTAHVRVQTLDIAAEHRPLPSETQQAEASLTPDEMITPIASPPPSPITETITSNIPKTAVTPVVSTPKQPTIATNIIKKPLASGALFIQLGAYSSRQNAQNQLAKLRPHYAKALITEHHISGQTFYRVRIGPYQEAAEVEQTIDALQKEGFKNHRVIIE